jgi:hypothetical protein
MKTVYLARAESRNFSFQAVGSTKQSANLSLLRGLKLHGKQYNLEAGWWEEWADMSIEPMTLGEVYRDGSQLQEVTQ